MSGTQHQPVCSAARQLWQFLLVSLMSCSQPGHGEFLSVHVTRESGVTASCFVVRATAVGHAPRTTRPMIPDGGEQPLHVVIFRDDSPREVGLEALGYADEGCLEPTGEQSEPQSAAFARQLVDTGIVLRVLKVPIVVGADVDGDGSATPEDCDDGNPAVKPGFSEACGDTFDNDCDGTVDCEDADCIQRSCGLGVSCLRTRCTESDCGNGVDDDVDGSNDCADEDCALRACGAGLCHFEPDAGSCQ